MVYIYCLTRHLKEPDLHEKSLWYTLNEPLIYTKRALFALERALVTLQRDLFTPIIYIGHCIELRCMAAH
jgi:hypothetical protein